ncbi:MAG TPA: hypothetical protein DCR95_04415 [Desulfobacter sp.]|nr:hypothetical protein [Desulfobacter sp.]
MGTDSNISYPFKISDHFVLSLKIKKSFETNAKRDHCQKGSRYVSYYSFIMILLNYSRNKISIK